MSLRTKASLLVTLLVITFFAIAGYLWLRFLETSLRKSIHDELKTISDFQSHAISSFLNDTLRDAVVTASLLPSKALEKKDAPIIESHLKTLFTIYPKFGNGLFILDEKGNLWVDYPSHPEVRGRNFSHREYFKTTMEKQKGVIGVPYRSARTGMPVITFTGLLKGTRNQVVGLIGCSVQLPHPDALGGIRKIKIGETGYLSVIDSSGTILLHPEDEKVFQKESLFLLEITDGIRETIDSHGNPIILSVSRIPDTPWFLTVQQDKSEAFAPIDRACKRILWATLIAVFIFVLIGNLAVRRLTGPLQKLQNIVKEFGESAGSSGSTLSKGYQERLTALSSPDEIGRLAKAFSKMIERLDQTYLSLMTALKDWERTFSAVSDPIFILDRENRILRINRVASELIGIPMEKAVGEPCYKLIHRSESPPPDCPHQQTLITGNRVTIEVEEPLLKGFFEVTTTPLTDEMNNVIGTIHAMRDITKRKQDEVVLKESEERYRTLVESARDVIFTLSPDGTITSLNSAFESVTGWRREEWIGKSFGTLIHPDDQESAIHFFNRALEGNNIPPFELRFQHQSGEHHIGEVTVASLLQNGKIKSILGIARDITERKKNEEAHRLSEEKFSKIYQTSPAGIAIASLEEGRLVDVNDTFLKITGFERDEIIGRTSIELKIWNSPDDRNHFVAELKEKGYVRNLEVVFRKKSGEVINVLISSELIEIAGEKYILSASLDITDRKKIEESLSTSEERYRSLVESSSDAILQLDLERQILSCNPAFSKLFGYERDEIVGKSARILHPSDESYYNFGQRYYPVIHQKGFFRCESELLRKEGEKIVVEEVISAIRTPDGTISGYVATFRDMTDHKRMEQEKAHLEEQLRQSQKMEAIGILAGGVAHDFNNLLTVIQGNCELLLFDLSENHPLRKGIEQISGAAHRAANLTRQLLAFSRRQILEPRVFDLNEVIKNLDKMLRRIIGEDIQLITIPARDLGKVKADPSQIEQVILNLAVNARDAMPKGGTLTIETANAELDEHYARTHISVVPGRYVMLSVTDTGHGMTPEIAARIFEPFFTTKEKGKGTGLGLSTVYGIVKQSGGNIWVYSEPDKGTTFKIYLPRVDEPPDAIAEKKEVSEIPGGKETVLLVEDDENVRMMTAKMLAQFGYKVLTASDVPQAVRLFEMEKDSIDLILTDVVMPTMGGREMAKQMQRLRPDLKVLYMSGYTDNAIAHHGILEAGIDYIQKPFTLESLLNKVREVLDRRNS